MPGAGTDKTKRWIEQPAPVVVLVEPQLGENIGAAARAMANFGLARLRLVQAEAGLAERARRRDGGRRRPHSRQRRALRHAGGGGRRLHLRAGDHRAQPRPGQAGHRCGRAGRPSRWRRASPAARRWRWCSAASATGWRTTKSASPTASSTLPVNPAFASLNLAQAVVDRRLRMVQAAPAAGCTSRCAVAALAAGRASSSSAASSPISSANLEKVEFFRPPEKRGDHADQPAQHLSSHGADPAGHPHLARRHHGAGQWPQRPGARRRARSVTGRKVCAR